MCQDSTQQIQEMKQNKSQSTQYDQPIIFIQSSSYPAQSPNDQSTQLSSQESKQPNPANANIEIKGNIDNGNTNSLQSNAKVQKNLISNQEPKRQKFIITCMEITLSIIFFTWNIGQQIQIYQIKKISDDDKLINEQSKQLNELKQLLKELNQNSYIEQIKELQAYIDNFRPDFHNYGEIEQNFTELTTNYNTLTQRILSQDILITNEQNNIQQIQLDINNYKNQLNSQVSDSNKIKTYLDVFKINITDISNKINEQSTLITAQQNLTTLINTDLVAVKNGISDLNNQLNQQGTVMNQISTNITIINSNITDSNNKINQQSTLIAAQQNITTLINSSLVELKNNITDLYNQFNLQDSAINKINTNITTINSSIADSNNQINQQSTRITTQQSVTNLINQNLTAIKLSFTDLQSILNEQILATSQLDSNMTTVKSNLTDFSSKINQQSSLFVVLQNSTTQINTNLVGAKQNISDLYNLANKQVSVTNQINTNITIMQTDLNNKLISNQKKYKIYGPVIQSSWDYSFRTDSNDYLYRHPFTIPVTIDKESMVTLTANFYFMSTKSSFYIVFIKDGKQFDYVQDGMIYYNASVYFRRTGYIQYNYSKDHIVGAGTYSFGVGFSCFEQCLYYGQISGFGMTIKVQEL